MKLRVNGEELALADERPSVQDLLRSMRYDFPLVVVERNGDNVPREERATTLLAEGDSIEVYHLVTGG